MGYRTMFRSLPNDNKISDNKIRKISKVCCHGISQEKQRFAQFFRKFSPPPQPPPKRKFYSYCRFGVSEFWESADLPEKYSRARKPWSANCELNNGIFEAESA